MLLKIDVQISCNCPLSCWVVARDPEPIFFRERRRKVAWVYWGWVRWGTESLVWLLQGITNAFRAWSLVAWCLTQPLFLGVDRWVISFSWVFGIYLLKICHCLMQWYPQPVHTRQEGDVLIHCEDLSFTATYVKVPGNVLSKEQRNSCLMGCSSCSIPRSNVQ